MAYGLRGSGTIDLEFGDDRVVAVDRGGGGDDDLADAAGACSFQYVESAAHVDVYRLPRLLHGLRHTDERGEMEDVVHALHEVVDKSFIGDAAFDEPDGKPLQIVAEAGAEVVEDRDGRCTVVVFNDVAADEPGATGNENIHVVLRLAH